MIKKSRKAFTLVEMMITLLMLAIFIMIIFLSFDLINQARRWNQTIINEFYDDRNIDTMFAIIENEIQYAGSMAMVMKKFDNGVFEKDANSGIFATKNKELFVQYASVEPLFFKKSTDGASECFAYSFGEIPEPNIKGDTDTWFTIYQSSLYTLGDLDTDFFEITYLDKSPGDLITKESTMLAAPTLPDEGEWLFFIRNIFTDEASPIRLNDGNYYYGEMVAKIELEFEASSSVLKMNKTVPWDKSTNTAKNSSYTLNLLENVEDFEVNYGYTIPPETATSAITKGNYTDIINDIGDFRMVNLKYIELYVKIQNLNYDGVTNDEYYERRRTFWLPEVL